MGISKDLQAIFKRLPQNEYFSVDTCKCHGTTKTEGVTLLANGCLVWMQNYTLWPSKEVWQVKVYNVNTLQFEYKGSPFSKEWNDLTRCQARNKLDGLIAIHGKHRYNLEWLNSWLETNAVITLASPLPLLTVTKQR